MRGWRARRCWVLIGLLGIATRPVVSAAQSAAIAPDRQKAVLSLYSARWDSPQATLSDPMLQDMLSDGLAGQLDYYPEFMDLGRFSQPHDQNPILGLLRSKYNGRRFDLIVATGDDALDFIARHREDVLFAGTPVVYSAAARSAVPANATGLIAPLNFRAALDAAISLQPDTTRVVVVSGASASDQYYEKLARDQFKALETRLAFTYLSGLPVAQLLRAVATLPPRAIVFYASVTEDGAGQKFLAVEILDRVSAVATVPTYAWIDVGMNHGIVGGRLTSVAPLVRRTAELALRVLAGENPGTIPVTEIDWTVNQFDWRQLQRWDISEARLPAGSTVLYRQPGAWEQYRIYIVGGGLLVMLQTGLIALLLVQRKRRTRMQQALRESEERFRLMADTTPVLIWRAATDKRCDFFNKPWLEFTGRTLEQELGDGWSEGVFPDDRDHCLRTYFSAFDARQPFHLEYRLRRRDGVYRWLLDSGVPRYGAEGAFAGYIGSCIDITERRDADESARVSQRRYSMATAAGSVGVWDLNLETNDIYVDPKLKSILGFEDGEIENRLKDWSARGHPEDAAALAAQVRACVNGETGAYEIEHRMRHKDGSVRWFLSRGSVVRRADGTPESLIGTDVDITERKAAERETGDLTAQLHHLAGRLIVAQETERARIARDLHDDVSQQLAGLAIGLSSLKRRVGTLPADDNLRNDVSSLQQRTIAVAENVRHLSHDLHSSVLQHAGLVAALTAHCDDLGRDESLDVVFSAIGDFESADADAVLCLYRVAQEALRNVVKHAKARRADVCIRRVGDDAELTVADDGQGFDIAETRKGGRGLGLISVHERARQAGGTVTIATELNGGTRVHVRIPVMLSAVLSQTPSR